MDEERITPREELEAERISSTLNASVKKPGQSLWLNPDKTRTVVPKETVQIVYEDE